MGKNLTEKNAAEEGFTLIELLVVIAIIGLLASIILVALNGARSKARDATRLATVNELATAMNLYYNDNGAYPNGTPAGWGVIASTDPTFLAPLVQAGDISQTVTDPYQNSGWPPYTYYFNDGSTNAINFILGVCGSPAAQAALEFVLEGGPSNQFHQFNTGIHIANVDCFR